MIDRVASYFGGCLADFSLLENSKKASRRILPFKIERLTALYLAPYICVSRPGREETD